MHARARDRGDVHDRAVRFAELIHQAACQHDRREEIHLKNVAPHLARGVDRVEPLAAFGLGRDRGVVDQRMQLAVIEPRLDQGNRRIGARGVGEIDLDVILRSHLPRAVFRKAVARAGDHAPAGGGEALHRRVPDAAACAGQQQGAARVVGGGIRHQVLTDTSAPWSTRAPSASRRNSTRSCSLNGRSCQNSIFIGRMR